MEGYPRTENNIDRSNINESARYIADMYIHAAEQYLEEGDPLRYRIVNYYSARPEIERELLTVLQKKSEEEISDYLHIVELFTGNPARFIEKMEKLFEIQDTRRRRREIMKQDRLASDEEYELGAYVDVLESQVKDAVLAAQKKGYRTFQSGFTEKSERNQFMDFYDKNIDISRSVLEFLQDHSIQIRIEKFNDRTTLILHPTGTEPFRIAQWREIWDTVIAGLPQADGEMVENIKTTGEHEAFREKQNSLRS